MTTVAEGGVDADLTGLRVKAFEDFAEADRAVTAGWGLARGENFFDRLRIFPRVQLLVLLVEAARVSSTVTGAAFRFVCRGGAQIRALLVA